MTKNRLLTEGANGTKQFAVKRFVPKLVSSIPDKHLMSRTKFCISVSIINLILIHILIFSLRQGSG